MEVLKLPLWKNCLEKMREQTVEYGKVYKAEFFEQELKEDRKSMRFGLAISEIRRALENDGFYLTGRGQNGSQYVILPPENNADVMAMYSRSASDVLKRAVILGVNTNLDTLTAQQKRRHEQMSERMAIKSALILRDKSLAKHVNGNQQLNPQPSTQTA